MFILSEEQFGNLLQAGGFQPKTSSASQLTVLDIGAGDGEVTQRLINAVRQMTDNDNENTGHLKTNPPEPPELRVYATEYSNTMRKRLQKKNFM